MQSSCFWADVWEAVIELITHLHSFSFGVNLSRSGFALVSEELSQMEEHQASCVASLVSAVPENTNGVGGAPNKPRLSPQKSVPDSLNHQIMETEIVWLRIDT